MENTPQESLNNTSKVKESVMRKRFQKTPEQNGVSERLNSTLVKAARSMLLDANLAKVYWAEAVNTAAYLKN